MPRTARGTIVQVTSITLSMLRGCALLFWGFCEMFSSRAEFVHRRRVLWPVECYQKNPSPLARCMLIRSLAPLSFALRDRARGRGLAPAFGCTFACALCRFAVQCPLCFASLCFLRVPFAVLTRPLRRLSAAHSCSSLPRWAAPLPHTRNQRRVRHTHKRAHTRTTQHDTQRRATRSTRSANA